jgi:hypothetical protein
VTKKARTPESTGEKRVPVPPVEHQFKPGNPGRPKGSRNKLGEAFIEAMHEDFEAHGVAAIVKVREEKPDQYLKVIASILPKDLNINVNQMDGMTDDELIERISALDATIRPFLDLEAESGTSGRNRAATAH